MVSGQNGLSAQWIADRVFYRALVLLLLSIAKI